MDTSMTVLSLVLTIFLAPFLHKVHCQDGPNFLEEPVSATEIAGRQITLKCRIDNPSGISIGAVQWTRNNFGLGSNRSLPGYPRYEVTGSLALGEYNLLIANIQLEDDADFQCQIGAAAGFSGKMSKVAKLSVLWPPAHPIIEGSKEISTNLWELTVVAGTKINITCEAKDGKPGATMTWRIDGEDVKENTYYSTAEPNSYKQEDAIGYLEITPTKGDQGKRIECLATNAALLANPKMARTYLEVLYAPEVSMLVEPRSIREGGRQKYICEGKGKPDEITWKWYEQDNLIEGATSDVLVLTNIMRDKHGHTVSCEGTNSVASVKQDYTLTVEYGPKFIGIAEHVAVNIGDDAELQCNVDGNPSPAIIWRRKDSPRILGSSSKLTLRDVSSRDFGAYTCTATVIGFMEITRDIHLLQNGPPAVLSETKQYAVYNDDAEIECTVRSVPQASELTWSRDGVILDIANMKRYSLLEKELLAGKKSIIRIKQVQDQDFGTYNCTVVNSYGSDMMSIEFLKRETIAAWVIALGVVIGFLVVVGITVALFMLYRKKHGGSEYGSDSSENTLQKKDSEKDKKADIQNCQDTLYGGPIDSFGNNRYSPEYDELNHYAKQPNQGQDVRDGGYNHRNLDPYGTFPGPAHRAYDSRYAASDYGPISNYSDYGTYGRARQPNYAASDYGVPPSSNSYIPAATYATMPKQSTVYPPPPASLDSRLATNV